MKIVAHNRFHDPIETEITRIVIYDDHDQPIVAVISQGDGAVLLSTNTGRPGERSAMEAVLRNFGIAATKVSVQRESLDQPTFE